jgi:PPOX class probable F420-dependent enzyme
VSRRVMREIPESHVDILDARCFGHVATLRPDGRLSNHPVCLLWDGGKVRFSTTKSRRKYRNLRADPRIAISVTDPENVWRYLEIRGTATLADDADRSFIDRVAKKYMGQDHYPFDPPGEERVVVTVEVEQVSVAHVHAGSGDGRPPADWTR